ncbi:hypothetical protein BK133_24820 [Paenibacillus sp. FSL H8-0548]|uniref:hypothetical protein n=1 Tax=Paenibacillus sp. FSL H8-0548 TaxID=1920422 RepID=UPI00096D51D3|nr:hypothetical protein [Paenibacillus sp. FSL H8-0548]OMF23068.1 hypothetical protein BK133_24820 [Paenibacillus sp. FSL H8-0548]
MNFTMVAIALALIGSLWLGMKPLLKKGQLRSSILYAVMVVWSFYIAVSNYFDWSTYSLISLVSFLFAPINRFINLISFLD